MNAPSGKTEQMRAIRDEVRDNTTLPLYRYRTENNYFPVLGEGSHDADIMFIGEAPGENEAKQGRPFCGAAGKLLDDMIASIGLARGDVYITNIVKDRPPQNRDPNEEEIKAYTPYLERQIDVIQPRVVATLGRYAMEYIFEYFDIWEELKPISKLHGTVHKAEAPYGTVSIVPLYHPAAALYNGSMRETLFADFKVLTEFTEQK